MSAWGDVAEFDEFPPGSHRVVDVCTHDGAVLAPPAYEALHVYPVRVERGIVQVRDDR